ncbi:hypothetical protein Vafri_5088 [Volvox africanus]|uniref:Transmembrane protein 19 n=1 Tax=Volvox africanus TaxID=51714 RepID=A0A8J4AVN2_9CHLO|nr:hypothetical protein Vafri_5088 [Volvox africanus]
MKPLTLPDGSLVPGQVAWSIFVLLLAGLLAQRGLKKGSLSLSGALTAFLVGAIHMACGLQYGATLIAFYLSSSKLTRLGAKRKALLEETHKDGGARNITQVLSNSLAACIFASLSYLTVVAPKRVPLSHISLAGAFLGHYACCCADTWASELGILSRSVPRLVTTGRKVPPGTNGGVTLLGLCCSVAGGLTIGLAFFAGGVAGCAWGVVPRGGSLCPLPAKGGTGRWTLRDAMLGAGPAALPVLVAVGLACGLFGSLLDSFLGATLQFTGWDPKTGRVVGAGRGKRGTGTGGGNGTQVVHVSGLSLLSNNGVNFIAAAATAALGAALLESWSVTVR